MKALFGFCYANEDTLDATSEITNPRADFASIISRALDMELLLANPEASREFDLASERAAIGEGPGALAMAEGR